MISDLFSDPSGLPDKLISYRSYEPTAFARLFAFEDQHFWFGARNQVISTLVIHITTGLPSGYRVLEVGCGTGNVLRTLERCCSGGRVVGIDLFAEALQFARQRTSCPLVQGNLHTLPFNVRFDLIGLFDVLEHLPNDRQVLRDLYSMLASGGALLLTVPAHPFLWSYVDEVSHHCRRYTLTELENKLIRTGYRVEYLTHYMTTIFPLMWLSRRLLTPIKRRLAGDAGRTRNRPYLELRITPVLNKLFAWLLAWETCVIARRHSLPIGASLLAVARRDNEANASAKQKDSVLCQAWRCPRTDRLLDLDR